MRFLRRFLSALAAALLLAAGLLSGSGAAAASTDAYLRLAHLSPDTPNVDVYVTSAADPSQSFVVPGVGYGAVSQYRPLPAGTYVVSMRKAGADPSSPAVISTSLDAQPGAAYTVAGTGMSAQLGLKILDDRLTPPASGKAAVRVINGAVSAPSVDVGPADGPAWATGVPFATATSYVEEPLGRTSLQVTAPGKPPVDLSVDLGANSVYSVLLLDSGTSFSAKLIRDSAGSGVMPSGGVETGYGGTAGGPAVPVGAAASALVLVLVGVLARAAASARLSTSGSAAGPGARRGGPR